MKPWVSPREQAKALAADIDKAVAEARWVDAARLAKRCADLCKSPAINRQDLAANMRKLERQCRQKALPDHAGLVAMRTSRFTKTKVGLWRSAETWEVDPTTPWTTTCEVHSTLVCHETRANAEAAMSRPDDWCEYCQEMMADKNNGVKV